jgi:hypothetical protein
VILSSSAEGGKALLEQCLDGVSALRQMTAVNVEFRRQVLGWHSLGDTPQDQHES